MGSAREEGGTAAGGAGVGWGGLGLDYYGQSKVGILTLTRRQLLRVAADSPGTPPRLSPPPGPAAAAQRLANGFFGAGARRPAEA